MTREEALDILGSYMTTNEKECWTPFDEGVHYAIQAIEKLEKIEQIVKAWNDMNSFDSMVQISEVLEDGNDD